METVVGADLVLKRGGKIVLAELVPAYSTTDTIRRITASAKA
jgi:bifunctional ADP-heptose synthase (sugar kinase/adenylyltransferase)